LPVRCTAVNAARVYQLDVLRVEVEAKEYDARRSTDHILNLIDLRLVFDLFVERSNPGRAFSEAELIGVPAELYSVRRLPRQVANRSIGA
jgi:hypothetical protein